MEILHYWITTYPADFGSLDVQRCLEQQFIPRILDAHPLALDIISQLHVIMNEEDMVNREPANKQKKKNSKKKAKTPKEEKDKEKEKEKEKETEKEPEKGEGKAKGKQKKKERKKEVEKERKEIQRGPPGFCLTPVVPPIIFTHRFRLTDLSPLELARQMTVFVATGLKAIIAEVPSSPPPNHNQLKFKLL